MKKNKITTIVNIKNKYYINNTEEKVIKLIKSL